MPWNRKLLLDIQGTVALVDGMRNSFLRDVTNAKRMIDSVCTF